MDKICERYKCYGCGLCSSLCPVKAISMGENDKTGHFCPIINNELCIDCQKCKIHCPANHTPSFHRNIETYAAWRKNSEKHSGSSSGGVAAAFYEEALKKGWIIVGAFYDEKDSVSLFATKSMGDIEKFKGSKYVQANTRDVYAVIAQETSIGSHVLFVGSPCQCEAARIAADKYNQNLLTVDLVCHGVPSQRLLRDYINWISTIKGKSVDSISFRSDWGVEIQMFSGNTRLWKRRMYWDYYLELFSYGYINNDACYQCVYANKKRASDITIGDFWGIGQKEPFNSPKCHVSLIGVNTHTGQEFLNDCKELVLVRRNWEEAVSGNSQLQNPQKKSEQYELFWNTYNTEGINNAIHATVYDKVSKRYRIEYPKVILKSIIKSGIKKVIGK